MAEGRICLSPSPCRTNCILLERPGIESVPPPFQQFDWRRHLLRVHPQREFVRQVASRSPSSFRHWEVNPENRQTKDANRQQFNGGKGIDEQNSDCG
jgi:hypothetical protein